MNIKIKYLTILKLKLWSTCTEENGKTNKEITENAKLNLRFPNAKIRKIAQFLQKNYNNYIILAILWTFEGQMDSLENWG